MADSTLCVIPARGGSKRIPRKNIEEFLGKPIIAYSIEVALGSGLFDEVVVSTDSSEIASVAEEYGAKVPFVRPGACASDTATTAEVLSHALKWFGECGMDWNYLCCLYPTAPFCSADMLREAFDLLKDESAPAVLPVAEFPYPILRSLKINDQGDVEMNWPEHELTRSQDLPEAYHDAGQFYWLNAERFVKNPRLMPEGTKPFRLSRTRVVDIDTPDDWATAEALYRALYS
ncbi:MAG: pseudaminic acid cytidylyltransferase [Verrucomicrobia bacterium]|nr:pseudaminic acid cytidylyltransferase [Verrucomicrobiota bacterium]